jgi:hypothetical protein
MILDKVVQIKIGSKNIKHFKKLKYDVKVGSIINVDPIDLMDNNKTLVNVECDVCGNKTKIQWRAYKKNINKYPIYCCNTSCAKIKENKTKFEKYGKDYEKNRVIQMKKTNIERYGTENTSQIFRNEKKQYDFITELKEIYKNEDFNYSKINYINNYTKVKLICKVHGMFEIRPIELLYGQGCKECNKLKTREENVQIYIEKSNIVHNNKYDYSKVNFINVEKKIEIICPIHGVFQQLFYNHLVGKGCQKCANIKRRVNVLKQIEQNLQNGHQLTPFYNKKACVLFDKISEEKTIHIQHAMNGGEFHIKELGYWVDGYDKKNNIVYEYDEHQHFKGGKLKEKDIIRQEEIEQYLQCKFVRIKD